MVSIGELVATLRLDDKLSEGLNKAGSKLKDFSHSMLPISGALAGIGIAGFKMSNDLNRAMANVASLMPNSTAKILEMKEAVKEVAHTTGKSSVDIAEALYQVVSANVAAADATKVLEVAAVAAAAGLSTTRDSMNLLALVTKAYGDQSVEAHEKVADLAFLTVKLGLTTYPELAASMGAVVPIAKSLNVSQEELFASMATLSGVTGDASEVSTQLKSVMSDMLKPSEDMSKAVAKLEYSGVEAMVANLGLVGSIRALISKTDGSAESIGRMFNNVRALPAVFALTEVQAKTFDEKLVQMTKSSGAAREAFKEQTEGVNKAGFTWTQFHHELESVIRDIGDELGPTLIDAMHAAEPLIGVVKSLIKGFGELPGPVKTTVIAVLALTAATAPATYVLGTFLKSAALLVGGLQAAVGGIWALGNTVPVLTARLWLMDLSLKGVMASMGAASIIFAKVAAAFAVGFAIGWLIRMGLEWVGVAKYIDRAASAVRQFFMGSNAEMEKGAKAGAGWSEAQKKVYDEFVKKQQEAADAAAKVADAGNKVADAVGKTGAATRASTAVTQADIVAKMEATRTEELLQKATELYGKQVTDPKIAASIVAMADAHEKAKEKAEKHLQTVADLVVQYQGMPKDFPAIVEALQKIGDVAKVAPDQIASIAAELQEAQGRGVALGTVAQDVLDRWLRWKDADESLKQFNETLAAQKQLAETLGPDVKTILDQYLALSTAVEARAGSAVNFAGLSDETLKKVVDRLRELYIAAKEAGSVPEGLEADFVSAFNELQTRLAMVPKAIKGASDSTRDWAVEFSRVVESLALLANIGGPLGEIAGMLGAGAQSAANYSKTVSDLSDQLKKGTISQKEFNDAKFVAQVNVAASAVSMLGGALGKSSSAGVQMAGAALQGAAAGAKMGAAFGPIGAGIGAVVGGIAGFISKSKQLKAEVTKLYDEFVKSAGGMEALKVKAEQAGVSLEAVFKNKGTRNVAAMKKAIEEANAKMQAFDNLLSSVGAKGLDDLKVKAEQMGVSLQAIWDAKTVEEYKAAIDDVKGKMDLWKQASDALNDAMERYGISVEELGPKFAQQKLNEQAAQLLTDWQLLAGVGVNINTLIDKMGPAMTEFVDAAARAGATIPEAMRPAIDALYEQGKLLHADGTAFTEAEYKALQFGKTQEQMFNTLIEKITQMVNALLGIPDIDYNVTQHNRTEGDGEHPPHPGGKGPPEMARGGIVTSPTLAMLGEGGAPEVVMPFSQLAAIMAGARHTRERDVVTPPVLQELRVQVPVDGRVIADLLLRRNKVGLFEVV